MPDQLRRRILILDDDYDSMKSLKEYLEESGWVVELTAEAALLDRLRKERFDLILLDRMILPEREVKGQQVHNISFEGVPWRKTGQEFLVRFRHGDYTGPAGTSPAIPVIMLSAVAELPGADEMVHYGPRSFCVEKPFRLSDLIRLIEKSLQENQ